MPGNDIGHTVSLWLKHVTADIKENLTLALILIDLQSS
jgi:hypothetical protein